MREEERDSGDLSIRGGRQTNKAKADAEADHKQTVAAGIVPRVSYICNPYEKNGLAGRGREAFIATVDGISPLSAI